MKAMSIKDSIRQHIVFSVLSLLELLSWFITFCAVCALTANDRKNACDFTAKDFSWLLVFLSIGCWAGSVVAVYTMQFIDYRETIKVFYSVNLALSLQAALGWLAQGCGTSMVVAKVGFILLCFFMMVRLLLFTSAPGSRLAQLMDGFSTQDSSENRKTQHLSQAPLTAANRVSMFGNLFNNNNQQQPTRQTQPTSMAMPETAVLAESSIVNAYTMIVPTVYIGKAKALFDYTPSGNDSQEVAFQKDDILEIINDTGKWWQVRNARGEYGVAPSNYLECIR